MQLVVLTELMFVVSTINCDLVLSAGQIYVLVYTSKERIIAYFLIPAVADIMLVYAMRVKITIKVAGLKILFFFKKQSASK